MTNAALRKICGRSAPEEAMPGGGAALASVCSNFNRTNASFCGKSASTRNNPGRPGRTMRDMLHFPTILRTIRKSEQRPAAGPHCLQGQYSANISAEWRLLWNIHTNSTHTWAAGPHPGKMQHFANILRKIRTRCHDRRQGRTVSSTSTLRQSQQSQFAEDPQNSNPGWPGRTNEK